MIRNVGFPQLGVPFGVPIIRIMVYWGLNWGPLFGGNYHMQITWRLIRIRA